MRRARAGAALLALSVGVTFCSGGHAPAGPGQPVNPHRITIGSNGVVSSVELVVPPGTRVLFMNNHNVRHDMSSDPHPDHTLCPEINQVGVLNPGQSRETGNLNTPRTCGFHDHDDFDNAALQGRIVIR